jgi:hypothetical protein
MKRVFAVAVLAPLTLAAYGQQTVCTQNGNQTTCTTSPTPYEQGQAIGAPIGAALGNGIYVHRVHAAAKKFCASQPGATYYGPLGQVYCPTDSDLVAGAVNEFHAHHRDFIQNQENAEAVVGYLQQHDLNPSKEKSYERAYKDLKKARALQLYAKS